MSKPSKGSRKSSVHGQHDSRSMSKSSEHASRSVQSKKLASSDMPNTHPSVPQAVDASLQEGQSGFMTNIIDRVISDEYTNEHVVPVNNVPTENNAASTAGRVISSADKSAFKHSLLQLPRQSVLTPYKPKCGSTTNCGSLSKDQLTPEQCLPVLPAAKQKGPCTVPKSKVKPTSIAKPMRKCDFNSSQETSSGEDEMFQKFIDEQRHFQGMCQSVVLEQSADVVHEVKDEPVDCIIVDDSDEEEALDEATERMRKALTEGIHQSSLGSGTVNVTPDFMDALSFAYENRRDLLEAASSLQMVDDNGTPVTTEDVLSSSKDDTIVGLDATSVSNFFSSQIPNVQDVNVDSEREGEALSNYTTLTPSAQFNMQQACIVGPDGQVRIVQNVPPIHLAHQQSIPLTTIAGQGFNNTQGSLMNAVALSDSIQSSQYSLPIEMASVQQMSSSTMPIQCFDYTVPPQPQPGGHAGQNDESSIQQSAQFHSMPFIADDNGMSTPNNEVAEDNTAQRNSAILQGDQSAQKGNSNSHTCKPLKRRSRKKQTSTGSKCLPLAYSPLTCSRRNRLQRETHHFRYAAEVAGQSGDKDVQQMAAKMQSLLQEYKNMQQKKWMETKVKEHEEMIAALKETPEVGVSSSSAGNDQVCGRNVSLP